MGAVKEGRRSLTSMRCSAPPAAVGGEKDHDLEFQCQSTLSRSVFRENDAKDISKHFSISKS